MSGAFDAYMGGLNLQGKSHDQQLKQGSAVAKLYGVVRRCVLGTLERRGCTEEMARMCGFHMRTFGSYRLGVDSNDATSDVDVLCVGTRLLSRETFFDELKQVLDTDPDATRILVPFHSLPPSILSSPHINSS